MCCARAGWVDHFDAEVCAGSTAYASMYVTGRYSRSNPYQNHPLLPLHILARLSPSGNNDGASKRRCAGCTRLLQLQCFNQGKEHCYVCGCMSDRIRRGLR